VELSHASGTCLPQENKGSGTLISAKTTFVGRQRLTCQRPDLNYLAELI
jgi:hypothetical protein